jgi:hypothetical protein
VRYEGLLARCDRTDLPETLPDVPQKPTFQAITLLTEVPEQAITDFEKRSRMPSIRVSGNLPMKSFLLF